MHFHFRAASAAAIACFLAPSFASAQARPDLSGNWPCFRGPDRMGIAPAGNENIPTEWSDSSNILWKTPLEGRGASSPIVWGDNVYVTLHTGFGLDKDESHANANKLVRKLVCIDRRTGAKRWAVEVPSTDPLEHGLSKFGYLHGYASSTPVADESGVFIYLGRAGVFAYDHSGKRRWHAPIGGREHNWGSASSPILFEKFLIVHADPELGALVAFDKSTGREVWRVKTGIGDSWSTPLVVPTAAGPELVFHVCDAENSEDKRAKVAAVDPRDGRELWRCNLLKDYLCPSPVAADGIIYWLAYQKGAATRAGGRGDVSDSAVLWTIPRGTEICTPIIHEGHLYWVNEESGVASCVDVKTGAIAYQERLQPAPGRVYASGVLVGNRIYYVSRENGTYVVEAKPQFRLLAHNQIASDQSIFQGTPAVSKGQMFLRSEKFLYCIGAKGTAASAR